MYHYTTQHSAIESTTGLFPTRIGRRSFLVRGAALIFAGFVTSWVLNTLGHAGVVATILCVAGGISAFVFFVVAMFRSLLVPRVRDIGLHPAWSLVVLVHALIGPALIALLLIPSDAFAKRNYLV